MKYLVTVQQADDEFDYEVKAAGMDEAEALAIRAHNAAERVWGQRAFVIACKDLGGPETKERDVNDGKHDAKLARKKLKHR